VPVYLWAGAKDDRVPLKSISRYAAEAKRLGVTTELLVDPEAGHNPQSDLSFEALVHLYERAAAEHFGSMVTPPSPPLAAFIEANLRLRNRQPRPLAYAASSSCAIDAAASAVISAWSYGGLTSTTSMPTMSRPARPRTNCRA